MRPESLHVTLVFLGYQPERDVERIAEVAFDEPAGPFELVPEAVVPVPPRRPRLYALGLEDAGGALARLAGRAVRAPRGRPGCTSPRSARSGPT